MVKKNSKKKVVKKSKKVNAENIKEDVKGNGKVDEKSTKSDVKNQKVNAGNAKEGIREDVTNKKSGVEDIKIDIKEFGDVLNFIEGDIKEILFYLRKKDLVPNEMFKGIFDSKKELHLFLKKIILDYLRDEYQNFSDIISDLRRKGEDSMEFSVLLISARLKFKLFEANSDRRSFNKCLEGLKKIKTLLKDFSVTDLETKKSSAKKVVSEEKVVVKKKGFLQS